MKKEAVHLTAIDVAARFSKVLRDVRRGKSVVVTSGGKAVAKIEPVDEDSRRARAKAALLNRLRQQPIIEIDSSSRDELYD